MIKYEELITSKHEEGAYTGKMDRLTYSKSLNNIIEDVLRMREEYLEGAIEKELVNALIREKNKVISDVIKIIEEEGLSKLNNDYAFNDEKSICSLIE